MNPKNRGMECAKFQKFILMVKTGKLILQFENHFFWNANPKK